MSPSSINPSSINPSSINPSSINPTSIEIQNLTKLYGGKHVGVSELNMSVRTGDFYGFIGPNGAGKTTAIKSLVNLIVPTIGTAKIFGVDTAKHFDKIKGKVGFMPSEVNLYDDLTVAQLLDMNRSYYHTMGGLSKFMQMKTFEADVTERLAIDTRKRFKELSFGNRKKVGFLLACAHAPEVLILDEPTSGLDPLIQDELMKILGNMHREGTTILLSSHTLSEVENNCVTVGLIKDGKMIMEDSMTRLKKMSLKHVEVFIEHGQLEAIENWAKTNNAIQVEPMRNKGGQWVLLYKTSQALNEVMHGLSGIPICDINLFDPTLETLFMHYYVQEEAGRD